MPVEAKVAAILRPIWPDLPMPVTITRPRAPRIRSIGRGEWLAEPVADRRDQGADAAGLGLQRANRRGNQTRGRWWGGDLSGFDRAMAGGGTPDLVGQE